MDTTRILGHVGARIESAAQLITAAKMPRLVHLAGDLPRSEIVLSHVWGQMCRCHMGHIMQAPLRSEIRQWHPVDADLLITSSERLPVTKADCNLFPVKCGPDLGQKRKQARKSIPDFCLKEAGPRKSILKRCRVATK